MSLNRNMSTSPRSLIRRIQPSLIPNAPFMMRLSSPSKSPRLTGSVKTTADHTIAFNMYVKAISFVFPKRSTEYTQYHTYLSRLFHSVDSRYHSRIIEFDKAVRNQVAMQRDLRLTDYSQFEQLRTTFLTSFGVGSSSSSTASGGENQIGEKELEAGMIPVINGIEGPDGERRYAHCCDQRGCRRGHKKSECPKQGTREYGVLCYQLAARPHFGLVSVSYASPPSSRIRKQVHYQHNSISSRSLQSFHSYQSRCLRVSSF